MLSRHVARLAALRTFPIGEIARRLSRRKRQRRNESDNRRRCEKFFHDFTSFQRDEIEMLYAVSITSAEKIVMSCIIIIVFFCVNYRGEILRNKKRPDNSGRHKDLFG